jgi:ArsR family transcriptional regulator
MDGQYADNALISKAFTDMNRLMIIEMLSCGELCGCKLLEKLGITQPTLSHHMKILCDCGLVSGRKEGKWVYYTLNTNVVDDYISFIRNITIKSDDCICRSEPEGGDDCELCEC